MPRLHAFSSASRRVLLCQGWWIDAVLTGVARYAKEHRWALNCDMKWSHRVPTHAGPVDGMIIAGYDKALVDLARSTGVPVVSFQGEDDRVSEYKVMGSDRVVGAMAAEHLLAQGFRHLGFVFFSGQKNPGGLAFTEFPKNRRELERAEGFREQVERAGARFEAIPISRLERRLAELPRPMGLMAFNDSLALDVLRVLEARGLAVPEEFAVIGVDDTEILCDLAPVPLSSVNCNYERKGYEAAAMLDLLMSGRKPRKRVREVPPKGVTMRRSTDIVAVHDLPTAKALRFLRDRYREPLVMEEVAQAVGVPLWRLQKAFRAQIGRSLLDELTRMRVEAAKKALADPNLKIEAVAAECGFYSRFHFHRTFVRAVGQSPMSWRQAARAKLADTGGD